MSEPDAIAERPIRRYPAAVSVGAMGLAWANQEKAPSGAMVVVDHEVNALGRLGQPWLVPAVNTLAFAVVLRPDLTAEQADVPWLIAALAVADGIGEAGGAPATAAWPDQVVDSETGQLRAGIRADVQLGPGRVRCAVATVRLAVTPDMEEHREELLAAIGTQMDRRTAELAEGLAGPLAAYEQRCSTMGRNIKVRLVPRGELRGQAGGIDSLGRLELRSATGMVERLSVNMIREIQLL